jgi:hypothetical protein
MSWSKPQGDRTSHFVCRWSDFDRLISIVPVGVPNVVEADRRHVRLPARSL